MNRQTQNICYTAPMRETVKAILEYAVSDSSKFIKTSAFTIGSVQTLVYKCVLPANLEVVVEIDIEDNTLIAEIDFYDAGRFMGGSNHKMTHTLEGVNEYIQIQKEADFATIMLREAGVIN